MIDERNLVEIDDQSEEGEIERSPNKDFYSEEESADTADLLEIKPPQAAVAHHRKATSSSHRRDKHSDGNRRENKWDQKPRHYEESRHRDKHKDERHRRYETDSKKSRHSDPTKREREPSRHEKKDRNMGDRILEDLRERLLDKRRERRDEVHSYKMPEASSTSSSRSRPGGANEDPRDRRDLRIAAAAAAAAAAVEVHTGRSKYSRTIDPELTNYADEMLERSSSMTSSKEKKHKKSHKQEKTRERGRGSLAQREKNIRDRQQQAMDVSVYEELERLEALAVEQHTMITNNPREMSEQELRRHRLLEAEREMARRKEISRLELEARRKNRERGRKRRRSPDVPPPPPPLPPPPPPRRVPPVIDLQDEPMPSDDEFASIRSKGSDDEMRDAPARRSVDNASTDSSSTSSDDDEDTDSNESKDESEASPLSIGPLAKSDRSEGDSPRRYSETNGAMRDVVDLQEEPEVHLPPYYPAIQGCRSVEEYKCLNRIAEGTYGVVYRAEDRRTKEIVALKRLKMEKEKEGFPITSLREINTLLKSQHPNIVTVREIVVGSNMDKIFIVMDYVEHDLKSLMETMKSKNKAFKIGEIKCIMQQLLKAVAHLHDNWILHRDLKTSNLLLSHKGILKVGDFGLAREYGSPLKHYTSIVVTLWYRAPELLLGSKEYSTPIDMWSVGCIFAELIRMEALFPGKSEIDLLNRVFKELGSPNDKIWPGYNKLPMVKKIPFSHYPVNNLKQRFNLLVSELGVNLLNKLLTYDPAQRITAEEAVKHKYFTETPLPIDPSMFSTWPAKSELGVRTNASPKPPSGGKEFKELSDQQDEEETGFHMGSRDGNRSLSDGGGFYLKF